MKIFLFIALLITTVCNTVYYPVYQKYHRMESVLQEIAAEPYGKNKCLDFSNNLKERLATIGIQSEIEIGHTPELDKIEVRHAWIGIWMDPQTGNFTNNYYK